MLTTHNLSIQFGGHIAVNQVSCSFAAGELTAIVGPNGAGKTTYFNLISGQLAPTQGEIHLHGQPINHLSVPARMQAGIGRAFQLTQLFPRLSVFENIRLVYQSRQQGLGWRGIRINRIWSDDKALIYQTEQLLTQIRLLDKQHLPATELSHGDQRKLEIGMLMATEPDVYMFDEPTAGMSADDAPVILDLLRELKKNQDKVILLVEHKMDVIAELADRVVVLHQGALAAEGDPKTVMSSAIVQQAYLGKAGGAQS